MIRMDKELSLEEIRKAQEEIAFLMQEPSLSRERQIQLEQTSLHLRELERLLVATYQKSLSRLLKKESEELRHLTDKMDAAGKKLEKLTTLLRHVIAITSRIIAILALAK